MVMAPLTRSRARQPGNVPSALNACYYAQRASAAIIISEATQVSQQGQGYAWTPGIHTLDQIEGWRLVTGVVHKAGGRMFLQLWHVARISHPALQPDGMLPVAPSAIKPNGEAFIENESRALLRACPRLACAFKMAAVLATVDLLHDTQHCGKPRAAGLAGCSSCSAGSVSQSKMLKGTKGKPAHR
jgi:2,4-dienoyl-CoA reductase-like NADH-dependent reductase (Old Yellow Enzyme family)